MRTNLVLAVVLGLIVMAFGQGATRVDEIRAQPGPTMAPSLTATESDATETPAATATPGATESPTATPDATETPTPPVTPSPTVTATLALETPIVDPDPGPNRVFLPRVIKGADAALPPPVVAGDSGWVASLNSRGREACAPATHVLLEKREGSVDNRAVAVLENRMDELELDFYIGEYVAVQGLESMTPETCRPTTWRHIGVVQIRRVPRPPGS